MVIGGLYFGLFTGMPGQGLGLLCFNASPFVFLTDKRRLFGQSKELFFSFYKQESEPK